MDITTAFKLSCTASPTKTLVKRPATTLLDAMNALTFFDPALDTGRVSSPLPTIDLQSYTFETVCDIMDKLLQLECSWHLGATLCDTVYTSALYHHPDAIDNLSLRAYVLACVKSIEMVYNEFARGHVNDGEDVWLDHHGLPIGLADTVTQILAVLDEAIYQETSSNIKERLILRKVSGLLIELTKAMLQKFDEPSAPSLWPETLIEIVPDPHPGFFPVTSIIRQSMPLPPSKLCDPNECLVKLESQMQQIGQLSTLTQWQEYLKTASLLPYVRSVAAGRVAVIDSAYCQLSGINEPPGIWRSIADGCAIATTRIPLYNRSRQRRAYLSVAHSWHERATAAFSAHNSTSFRACHAIRLDCLLEASLAAYDLDLYHPSEYAQTMWWIHRLTSVRCRLGPSPWAEIWMRISSGMMKKVRKEPLASPGSRERFMLRHKWARKTPYPRPGRGLVPRWEDWSAYEMLEYDRDADDGSADLEIARKLLADPTFSHLATLASEVDSNQQSCGRWTKGAWLYHPIQ